MSAPKFTDLAARFARDANRIVALENKCALLAASLKQADGECDQFRKALREIADNDPHRQSSAGAIARRALSNEGSLP